MNKLTGGAILIGSTLIWASVIIGSATLLKGTEYKEAVSRILYYGVILHVLLLNMMLIWTRKEKKNSKPVINAGITILLSAVIWGGVMIASSIVLKGTEYKEQIARAIQGGSSAHLLFVWAPIGILGNKAMEKLKKQKVDTANTE